MQNCPVDLNAKAHQMHVKLLVLQILARVPSKRGLCWPLISRRLQSPRTLFGADSDVAVIPGLLRSARNGFFVTRA
jgi:hypothetical protein